MSVKEIQRSLGVTADGVWGNQSQSALDGSKLKLDYSWDKMRYAFGGFTQSQVDGFNVIMTAINANQSAKNPLFAAYILATVWHETAFKMQSIAEYGKGKTRRYGQWFTNSKGQKFGYRNGDGDTYLQSEYPYLYYGRGPCQLTWLDNYIKLGKMINVDLANNPDLALVPENGYKIIIAGMLTGAFTGMSLSRAIKTGSNADYVAARKIINGTDCDDLIAGYAAKFLDCLIAK
nr:glycoside hydrolase family 19 protein [Moraxella sp. CTOTU49097]